MFPTSQDCTGVNIRFFAAVGDRNFAFDHLCGEASVTAEECSAFLKALPATDWTKYVAALTALVAVTVSPLLQWAIARRQAADNVSAKRQNWIDELRKEAAEYLTLVGRIQDMRRPTPGMPREDRRLVFDENAAAHAKAMELALRIRLRLNPKEDEHNELNRLFNELARASPDPTPHETPEDIAREKAHFVAARERSLDNYRRF